MQDFAQRAGAEWRHGMAPGMPEFLDQVFAPRRMIRKLGSRGRCASSHTSGVATHWERTPQPAPALIEAPGISFYKKTLCCSALAEAAVIADQHRPALPSNLRASCTQLNHDTLSWFSASISSGCLQLCSSSKTPGSLSISLSVMLSTHQEGHAHDLFLVRAAFRTQKQICASPGHYISAQVGGHQGIKICQVAVPGCSPGPKLVGASKMRAARAGSLQTEAA